MPCYPEARGRRVLPKMAYTGEAPPKRATFFPLRGTPCDGLYREAPPERGTFFRLQVYERAGILLVEVYKRVGKSVILVCKRAQKG